jgi:carbamoyltransferase
MPTPLIGPEYDQPAMAEALYDFADRVKVRQSDDFAAVAGSAADRISHGGLSAGIADEWNLVPRALGNRSILADPGHPEMRDRLMQWSKCVRRFDLSLRQYRSSRSRMV